MLQSIVWPSLTSSIKPDNVIKILELLFIVFTTVVSSQSMCSESKQGRKQWRHLLRTHPLNLYCENLDYSGYKDKQWDHWKRIITDLLGRLICRSTNIRMLQYQALYFEQDSIGLHELQEQLCHGKGREKIINFVQISFNNMGNMLS